MSRLVLQSPRIPIQRRVQMRPLFMVALLVEGPVSVLALQRLFLVGGVLVAG